MERASVSRLKDNLSAYLRKVRAGHPVVIYDRDIPIARIERIEDAGRASDRLALLKSQGLITSPLRSLKGKQWREKIRPVRSPTSLSVALRQQRDEER
jgi:antitoxin (DNA-binding transcriptional repressor) of toxin-antitoxin stability system